MKRKSLTGPVVKSVIFIAVTVTVTAILGISIAHSGVSATVGYQAVFRDVTGLNVGDDVDIAGVRVGDVTSISVYRRNEALVGFAVQAGRVLPASATATIKYLNLVGQRYIELGQGTGPVGRTLPQGGTIPVSQTTPALDLTELFNGFRPLFQALSPGAVNQLSSEIIQVFQGESPNITALVASVGGLTTALSTRDQVIGQLIGNLNSVLHTIGSRAGKLANFVPAADKLLGKGSTQHGLHVQMIVVPPLGPGHIGHYVAGKDTPVYGDDLGPHCYPIPFPGITLNDGAAPSNPTAGPAKTPARQPHTTAAQGQLAGSPTESELVRELTGMALGRSPSQVPDWGGLLTAPLFRGTTVSLRTRA